MSRISFVHDTQSVLFHHRSFRVTFIISAIQESKIVAWENQWEETFLQQKFTGLPLCSLLCLIIHLREGSQERNTSLSVNVRTQRHSGWVCSFVLYIGSPELKLTSSPLLHLQILEGKPTETLVCHGLRQSVNLSLLWLKQPPDLAGWEGI